MANEKIKDDADPCHDPRAYPPTWKAEVGAPPEALRELLSGERFHSDAACMQVRVFCIMYRTGSGSRGARKKESGAFWRSLEAFFSSFSSVVVFSLPLPLSLFFSLPVGISSSRLPHCSSARLVPSDSYFLPNCVGSPPTSLFFRFDLQASPFSPPSPLLLPSSPQLGPPPLHYPATVSAPLV